MSTKNTNPPPEAIDDDLQALADEIATNTSASAATALQLAVAQRPALWQYARQWDAEAHRSRAIVQAAQSAAEAHRSRAIVQAAQSAADASDQQATE